MNEGNLLKGIDNYSGATQSAKLNYHKKVFYFALPWEVLLIKKLDFEKTKAT